MQKARHNPFLRRGRDRCVSTRFQVLLTPLIGDLFTVQSPYWFTIGRRGVLRLGGWSPHVQARFHESHLTQGHSQIQGYRTITFFGLPFQTFHHDFCLDPRSLGATCGVAIAFLSYSY